MAPFTSTPSLIFSAKRLSVAFLLTTVSCVAAAEKSTSHLRRFESELESDLFTEDAVFWGREMQASSSMPPTKKYSCEDGCNLDDDDGPICGADGITYYNECLAVCQGVDVDKHEACPGDSNTARMMDDTYDDDSFVDLETMERFHSENFKFVGVRKFVPFEGDKMQSDNKDLNEPTPQSEQGKILVSRVSYDGCEYIKEAETTQALDQGEFPSFAAKVEDGDDAGRSLGVIETDTRSKVLNTRAYPYRYVGQILFDTDRDSEVDSGCSGTVISRDSVLTAAHCVHQGSGGGWYGQIDFSPARHRHPGGYAVNPYGTFSWETATTYSGWTVNGNFAYDIAVVKYFPRFGIYFDTYVGYAGLRQARWNSPALASTSITGYPGDKNPFEMWTSGICSGGYYQHPQGSVFLVAHFCDIYKGMSGSASMDSSGYISAVLSHETINQETGEPLYNGSVLLNGIHYQNVLRWSGRAQDA